MYILFSELYSLAMSNVSNRKQVSFRLPNTLMNDLRERATDEGVSMTELVLRFSQQGLAQMSQTSAASGGCLDSYIDSNIINQQLAQVNSNLLLMSSHVEAQRLELTSRVNELQRELNELKSQPRVA